MCEFYNHCCKGIIAQRLVRGTLVLYHLILPGNPT